MKLSKVFLVCLSLVMVISIFAGCQPPVDPTNPTQGTDPTNPTSPQETTIVVPSWFFNHGDTFEKWIPGVCDKFEADNPGVKIDRMSVPYDGYWDKIDSMIAANTPPDVFWFGANNGGKYIAAGALEPLNDLIDMNDINTNFAPSQTEAVPKLSADGKTYAVITDFVPYSPLFVTTTMAEIGVTKYPTNKAEWLDAAKKAADNGKYWQGIITQVGNYIEGSNDLRMWITGLGGSLSDGNGKPTFNSPVVKEVFTILKETYDLKAIPNDMGRDGYKKMMAEGDLVTIWDGAYTIGMLKGYNADFTDAMVGWAQGLSDGTQPGGADMIGVSSKSQNKELAAKFIMGLTSLEAAKEMFRQTYIAAPRTDMMADQAFIDSLKADLPWIEAFFEVTAKATFNVPFDLAAEKLDESQRILYSYFEKVLYENADIDASLNACQAEVEALFAS